MKKSFLKGHQIICITTTSVTSTPRIGFDMCTRSDPCAAHHIVPYVMDKLQHQFSYSSDYNSACATHSKLSESAQIEIVKVPGCGGAGGGVWKEESTKNSVFQA